MFGLDRKQRAIPAADDDEPNPTGLQGDAIPLTARILQVTADRSLLDELEVLVSGVTARA
ncbi:MAG TPA: hypothetical protein VHM88_27695 [Candidatus Acidoferrales bacterium]|nr:hypothetical protein [Candidatus Acidoferrales bacterium]